MNILIISYYPIYPFENGASIAQFGIIEYLSKECNISLLLPEWKTLTDKELTGIKKLLPNVKIYSVSNQPISNSKSAKGDISSKLFDLMRISKKRLKLFLQAFYKNKLDGKDSNLTSVSPEEEFAREFSSNRYYIHSHKYIEKINEIILQDRIHIVQIEFIEALSLVTAIPSNIKKIFIQHDGGISRVQSYVKSRKINSLYADYILNFYKCLETSLLEQFDGIISFNDYDNLILKNALGDKSDKINFFISPYAILDREFKEIKKTNFSRINKLIFVGTDGHLPNKDAVEWFLEETAEEVFQKFGLELHVVGKWEQNTVLKYKNHPSRVKFLGFVEDLYEIAKGSISIAPVRIGGGLRTKIMMPMAQGIPVICTKFALEGIDAKHLESVIIAEEKDSFCWAIGYILADLERTYLMCQNAQNLIRKKYSQSVVTEQRYRIYQSVFKLRNSVKIL